MATARRPPLGRNGHQSLLYHNSPTRVAGGNDSMLNRTLNWDAITKIRFLKPPSLLTIVSGRLRDCTSSPMDRMQLYVSHWLVKGGKSGDDRRAAAAQRPGLMDHRLIKIFRRIKNIWTCLLFTTGWLMTSIIIIIFCIGYRFTWWWSYLVERW